MPPPKCPATQALQKKIIQAQGTCAACEPQVAYLESIAGACPELADQVANLRTFLDHLAVLTEVGSTGINVPIDGDQNTGES